MHMHYCLLRCTVALAVAAIAATAAASNVALHGQEEPRFRSGIDLVNVTATVTDRAGRFVPGLSQHDFVVYEDDRPVEVALFSAERVPVSLGFVLDTSGSMAGEKIGNAFQAIDRFLDWLGPDDEVFLYSFGYNVELVQDWTTHRDKVRDRLRHLYAVGGTAMYDAMIDALPVAQTGRNRKKAIVLISDGNDMDAATILVTFDGAFGRRTCWYTRWASTAPTNRLRRSNHAVVGATAHRRGSSHSVNHGGRRRAEERHSTCRRFGRSRTRAAVARKWWAAHRISMRRPPRSPMN